MNAKDYYQSEIDSNEQMAQEYEWDLRAFELAGGAERSGDLARAERARELAAEYRRKAELFRKAKAAEESSG